MHPVMVMNIMVWRSGLVGMEQRSGLSGSTGDGLGVKGIDRYSEGVRNDIQRIQYGSYIGYSPMSRLTCHAHTPISPYEIVEPSKKHFGRKAAGNVFFAEGRWLLAIAGCDDEAHRELKSVSTSSLFSLNTDSVINSLAPSHFQCR